ncbi:MFS transporter [Amycolatopsis acidiphila]|uniref:MFS transporter n=2 Tax=Amycolatopsis acidiphila TaxID=715473 RepID=A0A557ZXQ7_9PSEU|nr:MFS transporter [Amycolatopsis acidiphila]TVT16798.1 MFS transporter [Amycolatopsis acidiphila]UIJ57053.1 MFS transporter [Amycolatopsis acidiphila]GHG53629.1 MFS transporter [Amycolatopsis acidiphila]
MSSPARPALSARRVTAVTVTILFVAWIVDYVDRLVISTALPSIGKEFGLDHSQQGLLLTVFFISYALLQFPGGALADRIGSKRTMVIAMVAWSVFTGLSGLATSFGMLLIVRVLFGVTEGVFPGAAMKAVTERTEPRTRMTANGIILGSNPFGAALAPLIAAPVITAVGWQTSFFSVAAAGVVVAAMLWFLLPAPLPASIAVDEDAPAAAPPRFGTMALLRRGVLWRFALLFGGFDLVAWGLTSWVPSYLQTVRHVSTNASGILASIPFFCATIGTVLGGLCYDRFFHGRHRLPIVASCVVSGIFLLLMIFSSSAGMFTLYQSVSMLVLYLSFMPIFGLPLRLLPREVVGSGAGLVNMGGQVAGALAPFVMGFLADHISFDAAFLFLELGLIVAIAAVFWTPQRPDDLIKHFPELQAAGARV